jgi:hypothetical protein
LEKFTFRPCKLNTIRKRFKEAVTSKEALGGI